MIVLSFLKKYWKHVTVALVVLALLLSTLILGIQLGKSNAESKTLKQKEKEYIQRIKDLDEANDILDAERQMYLDQIHAYEDSARAAANKANEFKTKNIKIFNNVKKDLARIDNLPPDSLLIEFSRLSEEYIKSNGGQSTSP